MSGRPKVICVVDDETLIADTAAAILRRSGYVTHVAYDGAQALKLLDAITPNLLISDVMMPGINGIQLGIEFKKRHPECKVILFSGAATSKEILEEARRNGYEFTFLMKPVHPRDLLRIIG